MRISILFAGLCLLPTLAFGQTTDTLEKLRQSRQIVLGVRSNAQPFSTMSSSGPVGYSVDLCGKVADSLRKELKMPDLKVRYVPVTAGDRIAKLKSGEIDIECGSSVNTKSRQADVAFSYSTFFAGEKLLVRTDSKIQDIEGLAGRAVVVLKGSTAEKMFTQIRDSQIHTMKLVSVNTMAEAFNALESRKVDAVAQVDVLAEGMRLGSSNPAGYALTEKALSVEPMGLMVRKNDKALLGVVDRTLAALYSSGEINAIYDKWFNSNAFRMPMTAMLRDSIAHPNREPAVALGLGYQM
jgi:glutamate/aspartate transport system substrate-binding protein